MTLLDIMNSNEKLYATVGKAEITRAHESRGLHVLCSSEQNQTLTGFNHEGSFDLHHPRWHYVFTARICAVCSPHRRSSIAASTPRPQRRIWTRFKTLQTAVCLLY